MINFKNIFKLKPKKSQEPIVTLPKKITFEYARTNPDVKVLRRARRSDVMEEIIPPEPFTGIKSATIDNVPKIYGCPENEEITIKNVAKYIEEPCIPIFLKLQSLGMETSYACAYSGGGKAKIDIIKSSLSEENIAIAEANNLHKYGEIELGITVCGTDDTKEVSNKLLELASIFMPQQVLYGKQTQSEYLNRYSIYNGEDIARNSNLDPNYYSDHLKYLLTNFPEYITFDGKWYTCNNMPDVLFQKEVLDRDIFCKLYYLEPKVCFNGIVWSSKELYEINERNKVKKQVTSNIQSNKEYYEEDSFEDINTQKSRAK